MYAYEQILADLNEDEHSDEHAIENSTSRPVISAYNRARAIQDGILVDVSEMAREAGISVPSAVTAAVWAELVKVPDGVEGQDEKRRLWDILCMFYAAARREPKSDTIFFDVLVRNDNTLPRPLALKAVFGPGDSAQPIVTIMRPNED